MKKYFSLAVTVWFAAIALSVAATPDKDAIMAKEKAAWQAFKDKNADAFKKLVDKDFRGVYAEGVVDLKAELDEMQKADMKSFTLSDFTYFSDEPDVIVTTYKCTMQGGRKVGIRKEEVGIGIADEVRSRSFDFLLSTSYFLL